MNDFAFPVFAAGKLHPAGSLLIPVEDQGFQLGLAVFETLLVEAGHAYFVEPHLERLQQGARGLEIPWCGGLGLRAALESLMAAIDQAAGAPDRYALRIMLSAGAPAAGPALVVSARAIPQLPKGGVKVWLSELRVIADALAELKASSRLRYVLARREAMQQGCYEALLSNTTGELAEGTISNVFVYAAGLLRTPPLGAGCLGGIMRQLLLGDLEREPLPLADGSLLRVSTEPLLLEHLLQAEEFFLTNSTGRLLPICELRGPAREPKTWPPGERDVLLALGNRIRSLEESDRLP